jgi:hypothetical protein
MAGAALLLLEVCAWAPGVGVPRGHAARPAAAAVAHGVRMVAAPPVRSIQSMFMEALSSEVATLPWEVHKFGGASLATAELYIQCAELLVSESKRPKATIGTCAPTMAIVSARGGVTDKLIQIVEKSKKDLPEAVRLLDVLADEQIEVTRKIASTEAADEVERLIRADVESIASALRAFALLKSVPAQALEVVSGYGEVWSALTMESYLSSQGVPATWLDAREVLIVQTTGAGGLGDKGSTNVMGTDPLWAPSEIKLAEWFSLESRARLRKVWPPGSGMRPVPSPYRSAIGRAVLPLVVCVAPARGRYTSLLRYGQVGRYGSRHLAVEAHCPSPPVCQVDLSPPPPSGMPHSSDSHPLRYAQVDLPPPSRYARLT